MHQTSSYDFSIIVPVYNETDNLQRVEQALTEFFQQSSVRSCVLFVNDGSTDDSLLKIRQICQRNADFYYISLSSNGGLSTALKAGIDAVESPWLGYIDSDLQTDPLDFNLLLPYRQDYALVTGIRADRRDSMFKLVQSKIANRFRRAMTGDTATDTGCPLKVMQTVVAKRLPFFNGMHRFLAALIALEGGEMKELPVRHYPRTAGVSKYHLYNRLVGPFVDCFAYRWMKKRYIRYQVSEQSH